MSTGAGDRTTTVHAGTPAAVREQPAGAMPQALHDYLVAAAQRHPGDVALVCDGSALTYRDLAGDALALARWLRASGVRRGDRVVVLGANTTATAISFWAALACGAVAVVLNGETRREKLAWIMADCGAVALLTDDAAAATAVPEVAQSERMRTVVVAGSRASVDALGASGRVVALEHAVAVGSTAPGPLPAVGAEDLAALMYTSGSTGEPKGVMLTHRNMVAATRAITTYLGLTADDVLLCVLPLSFDYGMYQLVMSVAVGGRLVLERSFGLPGQILNRMVAERVSVLPGVPTMFAMLARLGDLDRWDLSSVRIVTSTGAALGPAHVAWLTDTFPQAQIFSMYGLTECKRCTYLPPADLARKPGSVGVAIPGSEIWLVDDGNRAVGPGEVGELVVRGPTVMAGYWGRPLETAQRLRPDPRDGELVLHTGDLCRMDDEGYLYFVKRRDDVIKSRGEKVAPAEVEATLLSVPGVLEAAVVGVPDDVLGHAVEAWVVLASGSEASAAGLRETCRERLEGLLVPRRIHVVSELPRTPNGKVAKHALV